MKLTKHAEEIIAIIVTCALVAVMVGDFAILGMLALREPMSDKLIDALKDVFRDLILVFATAWRTNFTGSTTVNTEQANVSAGGGSPSPANVEQMTVTQPAGETAAGGVE
jgi:hypothetical protein